MDLLSDDARFAHIGRDPRYRDMQKWKRKVKIDKRFKGMFDDHRFKLKYLVDKRGRPMRTSTSEHLRRYYEVSISDEEEEEETGTKSEQKSTETSSNQIVKANSDDRKEDLTKLSRKRKGRLQGVSEPCLKRCSEQDEEGLYVNEQRTNLQDIEVLDEKVVGQSSTDDDSDDDISDGQQAEHADKDRDVDFARGEGDVESSEDDDDEDESSSEDEDKDEFEHNWSELDKDAPTTEVITSRLALCNMDWDRIKVADLYMLFSSFTPTGGSIISVKIYPSDYGTQKMKEENFHGPAELRGNKENKKDASHGAEYNREKLRQYQLNRLKYYYAVIECDSADTASAIYDNCDGTEYESSATNIDLRYIGDDVSFDQEPTSVMCSRPETQTYQPSSFVTTALQQSSVELTWDEVNKDRIATMTRVFKKSELDTLDMKDYLASDTEDSDDNADPYAGFLEVPTFGQASATDGESKADKYAALLKGLKDDEEEGEGDREDRKDDKEDKPNEDVDMEMSWEPGLKEATEKLSRKRKRRNSTPWESYLEKRREKRAKKREQELKEKEERKASSQSVREEEHEVAFSDDELPEHIDMDDTYFKQETPQTSGGTKLSKTNANRNGKPSDVQNEDDQRNVAHLSLLMMDNDDGHFSLRKIQQNEKVMKKQKKKQKKQKVDTDTGDATNFQINVHDSRFAAIFDNPLYNIDPTAPEFKKTDAVSCLIDEKIRRRDNTNKSVKQTNKQTTMNKPKFAANPRSSSGDVKDTSNESVLSNLVKSVKAKTKLLQNKKLAKKQVVNR